MKNPESHFTHRAGWLRASVLGANDGIVSTGSLVVGVSAAGATHGSIVLAGISGLVAGAMSMAAGEYVSVCSQADTENADLERERCELAEDHPREIEELSAVYVSRGLDGALARQVAEKLMAHDALGAHARDELGISEELSARPIQAAMASAAAFTVGAGLPLLAAWASPGPQLIWSVGLSSLICLALLGGLAAKAGGAPVIRSVARVMFWGALAMSVTAAAGVLFGGNT